MAKTQPYRSTDIMTPHSTSSWGSIVARGLPTSENSTDSINQIDQSDELSHSPTRSDTTWMLGPLHGIGYILVVPIRDQEVQHMELSPSCSVGTMIGHACSSFWTRASVSRLQLDTLVGMNSCSDSD